MLYCPVSGSRVTQPPAVMNGAGSNPGVEIKCGKMSTPSPRLGLRSTTSLTDASLRAISRGGMWLPCTLPHLRGMSSASTPIAAP